MGTRTAPQKRPHPPLPGGASRSCSSAPFHFISPDGVGPPSTGNPQGDKHPLKPSLTAKCHLTPTPTLAPAPLMSKAPWSSFPHSPHHWEMNRFTMPQPVPGPAPRLPIRHSTGLAWKLFPQNCPTQAQPLPSRFVFSPLWLSPCSAQAPGARAPSNYGYF